MSPAPDILVGCCGFPVARARYFAELSVVEIQQTFYQPPSLEVARRWRSEAPSGFQFCLKAWQLITHPPSSPTYRRLREPLSGSREAYGCFRPTREVADAWRRTLEVARALQASACLFQSPPSFPPSDQAIQHLRRFFGSVERNGIAFVWEPRGPWPAEVVAELCRELELVHGVDPFLAQETAGAVAYYRLHGIGGYRYRYTDADLQALYERCRSSLRKGRCPVYVLFNNLSMLDDARAFLALLDVPSSV